MENSDMENNDMKISTATSSVFDSCSTDYEYLDRRFRLLRECGFEAVDYNMAAFIKGNIRSGEIDDFWEKDMDALYAYFAPTKRAAENNGIVFSQAHATWPLHVGGDEKTNRYLEMAVNKTIAVCAFLGCPAVVVHPVTHSDDDREWETNLEMYRKMIPAAKRYQVKLCLENMFAKFNGKPMEGACGTAEESCRYIDLLNEEAGEDIFGFCLDIGHAHLVGRNLKSFIKNLNDRLCCLHIHDNDGYCDGHLLPYTQMAENRNPSVDWEGMIEGLREINYKGNISFETSTGIGLFPKEVEAEVLRLLSAVGRYFRKRILEQN